MRQIEQAVPSPDSQIRPTRRYTPNTNRGRGSARRWSRHIRNPSSPLLPLSHTYSGSPSLTTPRYSIHSSSNNSSQPHSSYHTPMPFPVSRPSSYQEDLPPRTSSSFVPPSSIFSSPPPFPSVSVPHTAVSNPNSSRLSSHSGVPLSSLSSSPAPLSHYSVPHLPHASIVHSSSVPSRPRTSSRIPRQGSVLYSNDSVSLWIASVTSLPHNPSTSHISPPKDVNLSQSQDLVLNDGYMESWQGDPPSPIPSPSSHPSVNDSPSTGPSPSRTHTQGLLPLPSSAVPSLTTDTPMYANINHPLDVTFNITPYASSATTVSALTHTSATHTTTLSSPTNTLPLLQTTSSVNTTTNPDLTRHSVSSVYALPYDATDAAHSGPIYENSPSLTVSTTTAIDVTTSTSVPASHSPIYTTVL